MRYSDRIYNAIIKNMLVDLGENKDLNKRQWFCFQTDKLLENGDFHIKLATTVLHSSCIFPHAYNENL